MAEAIPVVSYARISSDGERDEHGIADQHRVNRRTAKRLGLRVVAELTDSDRSASKASVVREGFEEMLRALAVGRIADGTAVRGVVVLNEDRLARRAGDYEDLRPTARRTQSPPGERTTRTGRPATAGRPAGHRRRRVAVHPCRPVVRREVARGGHTP